MKAIKTTASKIHQVPVDKIRFNGIFEGDWNTFQELSLDDSEKAKEVTVKYGDIEGDEYSGDYHWRIEVEIDGYHFGNTLDSEESMLKIIGTL